MSSESFEEKFEKLDRQITATGAGVISGGDWLNIAVHAIPWLIEYVKQLRVKLAKYAAKDLLDMMRDISEDCWAAGWLHGLEYDLWSFVQNGQPGEWGLGTISGQDLAKLRELSEACGGWWHWVKPQGETFISLDEWRKLAAATKNEWSEREPTQ